MTRLFGIVTLASPIIGGIGLITIMLAFVTAFPTRVGMNRVQRAALAYLLIV